MFLLHLYPRPFTTRRLDVSFKLGVTLSRPASFRWVPAEVSEVVPISLFTPTHQSVPNLRSMGHSGEGYQERDNQQRCLQRSEALEANGVRVSPSNASSTRVALWW